MYGEGFVDVVVYIKVFKFSYVGILYCFNIIFFNEIEYYYFFIIESLI